MKPWRTLSFTQKRFSLNFPVCERVGVEGIAFHHMHKVILSFSTQPSNSIIPERQDACVAYSMKYEGLKTHVWYIPLHTFQLKT